VYGISACFASTNSIKFCLSETIASGKKRGPDQVRARFLQACGVTVKNAVATHEAPYQ